MQRKQVNNNNNNNNDNDNNNNNNNNNNDILNILIFLTTGLHLRYVQSVAIGHQCSTILIYFIHLTTH